MHFQAFSPFSHFFFFFPFLFLPSQSHPHFHNINIPSSSHSPRFNHMINIFSLHNHSHSRSIILTHPSVFLLSFLLFSISCVFATTDFPTLALRHTLSSLCEVNKEGEFGSCCRTYDISSVSLEESPARDCFISDLASTPDGIEYLFVHSTHSTSILQHFTDFSIRAFDDQELSVLSPGTFSSLSFLLEFLPPHSHFSLCFFSFLLYLGFNFISTINAGVFEGLNSLSILSLHSLHSIHSHSFIFQLPSFLPFPRCKLS